MTKNGNQHISQNAAHQRKEANRAMEIAEAIRPLSRELHGGANGARSARLGAVHKQLIDRTTTSVVGHSRAMARSVSKVLGGTSDSHLGKWVDHVLKPHKGTTSMTPMPYGNLMGGSSEWIGSNTLEVIQTAGYPGWLSFGPVYANDMQAGAYTSAATYTGTTINSTNAAVGTSTFTLPNLPYTQAQLLTQTTTAANGKGIRAKYNHAKIYVENISPEIYRSGWGFIGQKNSGEDSINVAAGSYDTLMNDGLANDADVLEEGTEAEWVLMSGFIEDYEFRDEQLPFPRMCAADQWNSGTGAWVTTQVFPGFVFFPPTAQTQTYRVRVEFYAEYIADPSQFGSTSQAAAVPLTSPQPHIPEAVNIIPALYNANQNLKSANLSKVPVRAKHTSDVKKFFRGVGKFIENPVHEIEAGLGISGASAAAGATGELANALGDALGFAFL